MAKVNLADSPIKVVFVASPELALLGAEWDREKEIAGIALLALLKTLLERDQPYNELGCDYIIERQQKDAYSDASSNNTSG